MSFGILIKINNTYITLPCTSYTQYQAKGIRIDEQYSTKTYHLNNPSFLL